MPKDRTKLTSSIEEMMFGFGDEWPPNKDAVSAVESLAMNYIQDLCLEALEVAARNGKLDKECFLYLVRKEKMKFNRIDKLLRTNEELKEVQKVALAESDPA